MKQSKKRREGSGRPSILVIARDLMILWGALSEDGATLNTEIVSKRLGINEKSAQKLLTLVSTASGDDGDYLSLYSQSEEESSAQDIDRLTLMDNAGTRGRPLKLTDREYLALTFALNEIGLAWDSALRVKLRDAYSKDQTDANAVTRKLAAAATGHNYAVIGICASSIVDENRLSFLYPSADGSIYELRKVKPQSIRQVDDRWYLEAYDYDRAAQRTFRLDKMRDAKALPDNAPSSKRGDEPTQSVRNVGLRFLDRRYLQCLSWPRLVIQSENAGEITAVIPYYENRSNWLPRQIAACAGQVTTDDAKLREDVKTLALALLKAQQKLPPLRFSPELDESSNVPSSEHNTVV